MKKKCIGFLVVLVMLLQASAGAADSEPGMPLLPRGVQIVQETVADLLVASPMIGRAAVGTPHDIVAV